MRPLLSILIPAYCYPEGVYRILSQLQPLPVGDIELIVFDDSPDHKVESVVKGFIESGMPVIYQHNLPSLGYADNWNALLDAARGEFCLLLHHDEFLLSEHFVKDLITALHQDSDEDVIMLDCVLIAPDSGRNRRHLPNWLRAFVVNRFPKYLFRRNVIGPTSVLVIRRSFYPRFDVRLRWLIDVDVYVRLLKLTKSLRLVPQIQIGSVLGRSDSITARLGSSISQIKHEEQAYLRGIYHNAGPWLGQAPNESVFDVLTRAFEATCWNLMRMFTRMASLFCPSPVPRSVVHKALHAQPRPCRISN